MRYIRNKIIYVLEIAVHFINFTFPVFNQHSNPFFFSIFIIHFRFASVYLHLAQNSNLYRNTSVVCVSIAIHLLITYILLNKSYYKSITITIQIVTIIKLIHRGCNHSNNSFNSQPLKYVSSQQRTGESRNNSGGERHGSPPGGSAGSGPSDGSADSGSGSEGDEVEFVPSSWDCRAAPSKSSLRSLEQATPVCNSSYFVTIPNVITLWLLSLSTDT